MESHHNLSMRRAVSLHHKAIISGCTLHRLIYTTLFLLYFLPLTLVPLSSILVLLSLNYLTKKVIYKYLYMQVQFMGHMRLSDSRSQDYSKSDISAEPLLEVLQFLGFSWELGA